LRLALALEIGVPKNRFAVPGGQIERCPRRNLLAVYDVAQAPPSARPWVGENCLGLVYRKAGGVPAQFVGMHELRRGQARGGRLSKHPGDVVEGGDPVKAEM